MAALAILIIIYIILENFGCAKLPDSGMNPKAVLTTMELVADWQLENPSRYKLTDWAQGAGYTGMMALAGISGDAKYINSMKAMGDKTHWMLGPRIYVADDQCVGQTYIELYFHYRENKMINSVRHRFNIILANPPNIKSLEFGQPDRKSSKVWSWCDALFMAPPTWVRLYAATGDLRYLNFAVDNWKRTTEYLYDKDEHLFYRDSRYFDKREQNG